MHWSIYKQEIVISNGTAKSKNGLYKRVSVDMSLGERYYTNMIKL